MITSIDTNIFLDILLPTKEFYEASANGLEAASGRGSLVICDVVYAELCAHFNEQESCDEFLAANETRVEPLTRPALFTASRVWRIYRRQGGQRTRVLSDFLIGSHAQTQANCLLSRDRGFYRALFPQLELIDPSQ